MTLSFHFQGGQIRSFSGAISQTLPIALVAQICEEPTKPTPTKTVEKKIFIKAHASKIINAHLDKLLVKLGLNQ